MPPSSARPFNSWDVLKLAALLLMFIDHSGHFFFTHEQWLRGIGRGAPVIFLFLAGYASNYRFRLDIFLLALAMTISDLLLTGHIRTQNILFTILLWHGLFAWMEKHNKKITKPYEWFAGCFIWILPTIFLFQYGTYGLMFASCAYMKKRNYPEKMQRICWLIAFISYGAITAFLSEFSPLTIICMVATLSVLFVTLWRFEIRNITLPQRLERAAKFVSAYSGYIYALHLIALEWITKIPF